MEIDRSFLETISLGHISGSLSDATYHLLIDTACMSLANKYPSKASESESIQQHITDNIDAKQFYAGVCTIITEGCRQDVSSEQLKSIIDERLDEDRLAFLLSKYQEYFSSIRDELSTHSVVFPTIVDIAWRVDYAVHSNTVEEIREHNFTVTLTVRNPDGTESPVEFQCDNAQLLDLLSNVKDACNAVSHFKE